MKCATCDAEHDLLDPTFRRPEAVVALSAKERAERVKESDDLCAVWARSDSEAHRYFVRCVLKIPLLDSDGQTAWGLWAEVAEPDFQEIVNNWSTPDQSDLPAMKARIANRLPGYPETIDLPVTLRLTGPSTRPELSFAPRAAHPFAKECRQGVCTHRVMEWLEGMRSTPRSR